jgi:hypothetical protein
MHGRVGGSNPPQDIARITGCFLVSFSAQDPTSTVVFIAIKFRPPAVRSRTVSQAVILSSSPVIADWFLQKMSHTCPSQRGCFQVFVEYKRTRSLKLCHGCSIMQGRVGGSNPPEDIGSKKTLFCLIEQASSGAAGFTPEKSRSSPESVVLPLLAPDCLLAPTSLFPPSAHFNSSDSAHLTENSARLSRCTKRL